MKRGKATEREIKGRVKERDKGWGGRERGRRLRDREGEEAIKQDSVYH